MSHRRNHRSSPRRQLRLASGRPRFLAAALCLVLALATLAPAFALAREADSEGEGGAAPGSIPGLEAGELEPGGEETALGEVAVGVGEEVEEEAPEPEAELPSASEAPAPEPMPEAPSTESPLTAEPAVAEAPPSAPAPNPAPIYEGEAAPTYESVQPSAGVVENEALTAPAAVPTSNRPQAARGGSPNVTAPTPEEAPAPEPVDPPAPEAAVPQPATPVEPARVPGSLRGRDSHTVRTGECLWSIAEAALRAGADETRVAAEVRLLWRLNAGRIGTGDPSLILVGTKLRLH